MDQRRLGREQERPRSASPQLFRNAERGRHQGDARTYGLEGARPLEEVELQTLPRERRDVARSDWLLFMAGDRSCRLSHAV